MPGTKKGKGKKPIERQWQDAEGNPLTPSRIRRNAKKWTAITWAVFLKSTEVPLRERLGLKQDAMDWLAATPLIGDQHGKHKQPRYEVPYTLHKYDEPEVDPKTLRIAALREKLVRRALEGLTKPEQVVLELYYWEGLSEPKIARKVERHRSSVATWKRRGEQKLRGLLSSLLPISEERTSLPPKN